MMKTKRTLLQLFLASSLLILAAACDVKDPIYDPPTAPDPGIPITPPTDDLPWTDTDALPAGYDLTIANEEQLRKFAELVNTGGKLPNGTSAANAKVLQTADIELTQGEWTPIGNSGTYSFSGTYNGDGHTITGLTITTAPPPSASGSAYAGLFGYVDEGSLAGNIQKAVLTGIHLRKVQIDIPAGGGETELYVGSIVGWLDSSILSLCSAEGTVKASSSTASVYAGGIAGLPHNSTISRCWASVETTAVSTDADGYAWAGEIAGQNDIFSFILSCEAQGGAVTAEGSSVAFAGGIAGRNATTGFIAFCRTGANAVTAQGATNSNNAGGLVGSNIGYLYSCYSRATAEATGSNNQAGAIVGSKSYSDREQYCYGAGTPGPGNSGLAANPDLHIIYETSPGSDAIYDVMRGYPNKVESIVNTGTGDTNTYYPFVTRHTPATFPAHGIEPVRVKWGPGEDAWQRGTSTTYPEINMKYGGEDNPEP